VFHNDPLIHTGDSSDTNAHSRQQMPTPVLYKEAAGELVDPAPAPAFGAGRSIFPKRHLNLAAPRFLSDPPIDEEDL